MKVIGVINNYGEGKDVDESSPNYFLLADSSLLKDGKPFFVPPFDADFRMYPSLVVRVNRLGKNIAPRFASRYYDAVALGLNVRAENDLSALKVSGLPWSAATAFDGAAIMGDFLEIGDTDLSRFKFTINKNDVPVGEWDASKLITDIDTLISKISARMTLKIGDFIYVGFAENGFDVKIDDHISGVAQDKELLNFKIK